MKQSVKTKSIYAAAKIFNYTMSDEEQHRFGYETRTEIRAMIAKAWWKGYVAGRKEAGK